MLTIEVLINLRPIKTITAVNTLEVNKEGLHTYKCFEGIKQFGDTPIKILYHKRNDGFQPLVKQMIDAFP